MAAKTNHMLSAAIDFGTTFSGYAFSSLNDFQSSPDKVSSMTWTAGSGCLQSLKTSTCVLFSPDKKFYDFGFQAEDKYSELVLEEKEKGWYLFRRFKMELYNAKVTKSVISMYALFLLFRFCKVTTDMTLKSVDGKTLPALDVFSAAIGYMKDHLLQKCSTQGLDLLPHDIQWVLTVPAIWDDTAKSFMRKAAEQLQAGILAETLHLALEPEAAALYCKNIHVNMSVDDGRKTLETFKPWTKYMVLDAGGGTVDITVHQVQDGGTLKEVCAASGGDWGGTKVDAQFEKLLRNAFGQDIFEKFRRDNVDDFLETFRNFEVKKRTLSQRQDEHITFSIPASLLDIHENLEQSRSASDFIAANSEHIFLKKNKFRISAQYAESLFKSSTDGIVKHLKTLIKDPLVADISSIIMVGGYSECSFLQKRVIGAFPNIRVIVPSEPGLAVLKGAVISGHTPSAITHRVCRYTYGLEGNGPFKEGVHDEERKYVNAKGTLKCKGIFCTQVNIGDVIRVGHKGERLLFSVKEETSTKIYIQSCISTQKNPMYSEHAGCKMNGSFSVEMSDITKGFDRGVYVQMIFGGTEIKVEATDKNTGAKYSYTVDF
ncbi:heat shock 70 kDa protein 12B-like [Pecten maximus]|uniref:heat shock 70 kDa protein 12B-like n=1 Tax=Pecten maximus TaxID=6579 RepID=UPI001457EEF4|nr:heat shock 70 kDa protein 12B-like [Pecten maximus]